MIKKLFDELRALIDTARRKIGSLNVALIATLTLGISIAFAAYLAIDVVARVMIDTVYMAPERQRERCDEYADELQKYVTQNEITSQDSAAFTTWMEEAKYVYLTVYGQNEDTGEYEDEGHYVYSITAADGEVLTVELIDYTNDFYYGIFDLIKLASAVVILFAIMIVYVQRITARISRLAQEVGAVSGGDTTREIRMSGRDEIAYLAESVEQMRVSILTKIEAERAAIEANSELITSMSHDIRTPLTVLLGYIEMMKERVDGDPAMKEYVLASEKTAMRLKRLSDELFNYFLLFGNGAQNVNLSVYNFGFLADQMLAEYVLLAWEREYSVTVDVSVEANSCEILTDPDMLMRIIENLFSNMFKYADRAFDIRIRAEVSEGVATLTFTNTIDRSGHKVETNGIGLKSCRKIADTLGLGFEHGEEGDTYTTVITFPKAENEET